MLISKEANVNYLCKVIKIKNIRKHENADKLQIINIDFQTVITGLDAKKGDIYVFFPLECQINKEFLSYTNSFRHKELNKDKEQIGFFEDNRRVRAMKLRGEKSMGYIVPVKTVEEFTGEKIKENVGEEFDTIGNYLMCKKYFIPIRENNNIKQGKKPKISRMIDGQFRFHVDTENLRKNMHKIDPEDDISITYKTHGTSAIVSNISIKRKLNIIEKALKCIGVKIVDTEYDYIYSSRKIIKNDDLNKNANHFYKEDIWKNAKDELKDFVPKGYTIYCEILGYLKSGKAIQGLYDYGCERGKKKIQVYRITFTNIDGFVHDLSTRQIKEYCDLCELEFVHLFYNGKAKDLFNIEINDNWNKNFIKKLEKKYNEKKCFMCKNDVPEEGIVLRKEKPYFEAYKLKSFAFLKKESEELDKGEEDIESVN